MKHILISIVLFTCFLSGYAQDASKNPMDEMYTPPSNSFLNNANSSQNYSGSNEICKNSIKLNTTNLFRSNLILQYEHVINDDFSFTACLGTPMGIDYIHLISFDEAFRNKKINEGELDLGDYYENLNFRTGIIFGSSLRWFIENDVFYEVGFKTVLRKNYFDLKDINLNIASDDIKYNITGFFMNRGHRLNSSAGKLKLTHEILYGFGIKYVSYDCFNKQTVPVSKTNTVDIYVRNGEMSNHITPYISFSYNIGIGW